VPKAPRNAKVWGRVIVFICNLTLAYAKRPFPMTNPSLRHGFTVASWLALNNNTEYIYQKEKPIGLCYMFTCLSKL